MDLETALYVSAGVAAGVVLLQGRVNRSVQQMRLEMAVIGEELLAEPELHDDVKTSVRVMLDTAYSALFPLIIAVAMPFLALWLLFDSHERAAMRDVQPRSASLKAKLAGFEFMHLRSTLAANILLAPVIVAELFLLVLCLAALGYTNTAANKVIQRILRVEDKLQHRMGH